MASYYDIIAFIACVGAGLLLIRLHVSRRSPFGPDVLSMLLFLTALSLFRNFSNILEWTKGIDFLVPLEDYPEVLVPVFYFFTPYIFILDYGRRIIRDSEERYRSLVENINLGIALLDSNLQVQMTNSRWRAFFGSPDGNTSSPLTRQRDLSIERFPYIEELKTGAVAEIEVVVDLPDRPRTPFRLQVCPLLGDRGQFKGGVEIAEDITERKLAEEVLKRSRLELIASNGVARAFLTSSKDTIYADVLQVVFRAIECCQGLFGVVDARGDLSFVWLVRDREFPSGYAEERGVLRYGFWKGLWARALINRETVTGDVSPDSPAPLTQLTKALITPITYNQELIGAIAVDGKPAAFSDLDISLMEHIAAQVAPILKSKLDSERFEKDRLRLEAQLRQSQKMEAVGALAGGISHDFNNILSAILGYAELAYEDCQDNEELRDNLAAVLDASRRAQQLVSQILSFSRQTDVDRRPIHLQPVVREAITLLRSTIPSTIPLRARIDTECGTVCADSNQISQVIINICTNAYQSMQKKETTSDRSLLDFELQIELFQQHLSEQEASVFLDLSKGDYVCLRIRDSGIGMDEKTLDRIFEPYYSTRDSDQSSGMGLATVHSIVKSHNGDIAVESQPGHGTTFTVFLPICESEPDETTEAAQSPEVATGREQVLFVDDEPMIVTIVQRTLERLGYHVTTAEDGMQAFNLFQAAPDQYDIVITDLTMPNLDGLDLLERVKALRPHMPTILCSGYSQKLKDPNLDLSHVDHVMAKPLVGRDLAKAIRETVMKYRKS